jgi:hypothetical protein
MKIATSILALVSLLACLPAQAVPIYSGGIFVPAVRLICVTIDEHTDFDTESCPVRVITDGGGNPR